MIPSIDKKVVYVHNKTALDKGLHIRVIDTIKYPKVSVDCMDLVEKNIEFCVYEAAFSRGKPLFENDLVAIFDSVESWADWLRAISLGLRS